MVTQGSKEEAAMDPMTCQEGLNMNKGQEIMVVAVQNFAQEEAATGQISTHPKTDEGVEPFMQACMKLLRNPKAIENLQALMNICTTRIDPTPRTKDVHKLYRYKKHNGREMR